MIDLLKSKIKKYIYLLSGRFDHLRIGVKVNKKWYGNEYGGFYACPDLLHNNSIIYSFGIGEDISFDESIISTHSCSVFGFDPTPKSIQWINSRRNTLQKEFTFFEYGIADKSGIVDFYLPKNTQHVSGSFIHQGNVDEKRMISVAMKSLTDITTQLEHTKIDILKMDIEGAEYQVLESVLNSPIQIDQILVEFHERFFADGKVKTTYIINKMKSRGYEIFGISDSFDEISFISRKGLGNKSL